MERTLPSPGGFDGVLISAVFLVQGVEFSRRSPVASGITFRYLQADVSDAESVRRSVQQAEAELGSVTLVLHAAGINVPQLIGALDAEAFYRTLRPKITGIENLLSALDADRLRLLVAFGSLIARTGLPGEADYGVANDWLRLMVERWH